MEKVPSQYETSPAGLEALVCSVVVHPITEALSLLFLQAAVRTLNLPWKARADPSTAPMRQGVSE
jgi:hypothetical protein